MSLVDNPQRFGLVSMLLHWSMAIIIIGLFVLGKYMVDLDYYSPWYKAAPDFHRSMGFIVALLLIIRLGWRLFSSQPTMSGKNWEKVTAAWAHRFFYVLILAIVVTGYLTTTADGHPVYVFDWFSLPATLSGIENQEDIAGATHEILTNTFIILVVIHVAAALKHHFLNHDTTLLRMLGRTASSPSHISPNPSKKEIS